MKLKLLSLVLSGSFLLYSCNSEDAFNDNNMKGVSDEYADLKSELLESTTTTYTDEQIDVLISQYFSGISRDVAAPANLAAVFRLQFPNARDIEWEMSNDIYCVEFEIGNVDHKVLYDAQGNALLYVYDVRVSDLPKVVSDAALQRYPTYRIDDAERVLKGSAKAYLLELEKNGARDINVVFSETGTFLYEQSHSYIPPMTSPDTADNHNSGEANPDAGNKNPEGSYTNEQIISLVEAFERAKTRRATPPAAVLAAFNSQFANVRDIEWESDNVIYNVEFEIGNVDYEAWYDANGVRLMHMKDIRTSEIPAAVNTAIARDYAGFRIDDEPNKIYINSDVIYEVSIEKGRTELDVYYLENGVFLKEIVDY